MRTATTTLKTSPVLNNNSHQDLAKLPAQASLTPTTVRLPAPVKPLALVSPTATTAHPLARVKPLALDPAPAPDPLQPPLRLRLAVLRAQAKLLVLASPTATMVRPRVLAKLPALVNPTATTVRPRARVKLPALASQTATTAHHRAQVKLLAPAPLQPQDRRPAVQPVARTATTRAWLVCAAALPKGKRLTFWSARRTTTSSLTPSATGKSRWTRRCSTSPLARPPRKTKRTDKLWPDAPLPLLTATATAALVDDLVTTACPVWFVAKKDGRPLGIHHHHRHHHVHSVFQSFQEGSHVFCLHDKGCQRQVCMKQLKKGEKLWMGLHHFNFRSGIHSRLHAHSHTRAYLRIHFLIGLAGWLVFPVERAHIPGSIILSFLGIWDCSIET